jgi:hypothetical protein
MGFGFDAAEAFSLPRIKTTRKKLAIVPMIANANYKTVYLFL